jgi:hypothetical protein
MRLISPLGRSVPLAAVIVACVWLASMPAGAQPASAPQGASAPPATTPASASPLLVRVEQAAPLKLDPGASKPWWELILAPIISGLTALGGALIGGLIAQRSNAASINQKANEAELKEIRTKLETFYGPFAERLEEGRLLAHELRQRQPDKKTFRTMMKLLDAAWLQQAAPADRTIMNEIVQNGTNLITLIREKAGSVDPALASYLARAATHFLMLKLAKDGALEPDPARFERYAYPRELDGALALELQRLNARADLLQREPGATHAPLTPLVIPAALALPAWPDPEQA